MKHQWKLDEFGKIDTFAYEFENHNGPVCSLCGIWFCHHCEPECYDYDDCPGMGTGELDFE